MFERTSKESYFDKILIDQAWNITPSKNEIVIPTSINVAANAAKTIAICAYPQENQLRINGKAHKYAQALLSYIVRASQWTGHLDTLPAWTRDLKSERMWDRLETGHRNLLRTFVVRDLISSALISKSQYNDAKDGRPTTFLIKHSADLKSLTIKIPIRKVDNRCLLPGTIPEVARSSLRAAVKEHYSAFCEFAGPSPRIEGPDEEYNYQNTLTRFIKPIPTSPTTPGTSPSSPE